MWKSNDKQNVWELSGLFEGDIILNNEKATRNGVIDAATRWPNGTIPYLIRDNDFGKILFKNCMSSMKKLFYIFFFMMKFQSDKIY